MVSRSSPRAAAQSMIHLVRHADAGLRTATPEDRLRSLSVEGWRQVQALTSWLQPGPLGRVLSSPYVRCVQTVERIAAGDGHDVVLKDELAEGSELGALLDLLAEVPEGSILCTHGDMLKAVISWLEGDQALLRGPACVDKGVVWVLSRVGCRFPQAAPIPPLTARAEALAIVDRIQKSSRPASLRPANSLPRR
jgi:phosphohistidine phosphatase SixA